MQAIISLDIELEAGSPHPLPWYPPLCDAAQAANVKLSTRWMVIILILTETSLLRYSSLLGLRQSITREKYPDDSIKEKMLESFGQVKTIPLEIKTENEPISNGRVDTT